MEKDFGSWKGQGDWEEEWGEAYAGKRQPALFVIDVDRFHQSLHKRRTVTYSLHLSDGLFLLIVERSSQSKEFQDR